MARHRRQQGDVELNLAAMLDMAFQLLTFFILTFKPSPVEGQISLRLPPPQPVATVKTDKQAGDDTSDISPVAGIDSLIISIFPNAAGQLGTLAIGETNIGGLPDLETKLRTILKDPDSPFKQVIIQVGGGLHYEELMKVIDVCTRQTLADGEKLTKLSFVELPDASPATN